MALKQTLLVSILSIFALSTQSFILPSKTTTTIPFQTSSPRYSHHLILLEAKKPQQLPKGGLTNARKKQLGVTGDEDEYDLDVALDANTDPLITKIIAGSAILAIIALLVVGVIIPSTSDFGDGVCVPIQNGGRC